MLQLPKQASEELAELEGRLRGLRQEHRRARDLVAAAKSAVAASETDATVAAAQEAVKAEKAIANQIDELQEQQIALLGQAGGPSAWGHKDGFADAARRLDLSAGTTRVDLAGGSLLRAQVTPTFSPRDTAAVTLQLPPQAPPQDRRFAYRALRQQPADSGSLAVGGFTVSYTSFGTSGLTGLERDPLSTEPKQELGAEIGWDSRDLKQFAIVLDDIPQAVLNAESELQRLLQSEMRYRIDLAIDAHVINAIEASAPPSGSNGPDLIAQVRNAIAASRVLGANPTTLLLSPSTAATLDLTQVTGAGYVFAVRSEGSASPLWNLVIRESEAVSDPILLDPMVLGPLVVGVGTVLADPYTKMTQNVVRLRTEIEALCFVRDPRGAYVISA